MATQLALGEEEELREVGGGGLLYMIINIQLLFIVVTILVKKIE